MGEEKKPDVFNTQEPPKREAPDFDTIYSVNEKGYSEAQKAEAKELADVARSQWETREAKLAIDLNPPAPAAEDVLDMPSKESTDTVNNEVKLNRLSEPRYKIEKDMDAPFDLVELPSRGKIGPYNKDRIKVAKLTTADEDILTSYGIVESGEFFDYLFERKILDETVSYRDLHVGDRNALMIWLRATGYGHIYPVTFTDPADGSDFKYDIDLSDLKVKYLELEPNDKGYFEFTLPSTKKIIEFKYLSVDEIESLETEAEIARERGDKVTKTITSALNKQIVSIDGETNPKQLSKLISVMSIGDSRAFRKYYDVNESGIDLTITIETPGGVSRDTFLPLGLTFFWPDL